MKQGILLTAYNEIEHLKRLINFFDDNFFIYIHIDKKSKINEDDIEAIRNTKNVVFISRQIKVNWGGIRGIQCTLLLAKEALKNQEIEYFHLISGQDFPVKSCAEINTFLTQHKGKEFMEFNEISVDDWSNKGLAKIGYFNCYDLFNAKTTTGKLIIGFILKAQKFLNIKRSTDLGFPKLFGGSTWWTVSYACLKYIVDYSNNSQLLFKRLKHTFAPDEIYFPSLVMNSHFRPYVVNNNLRYINWEYKNGSCPAIIDETDYEFIIKSDAIFARKFKHTVSDKLMNNILNANFSLR